jgi:hypothetical protein
MLIFSECHLRRFPAEYARTTTDDNPLAAASSARSGPTNPSPTSPRSGPSAARSSAASSTNSSEPHIEAQVKASGRVLAPHRVIGTLRRELSGRLLIINEHHLRRVLTGYLLHYSAARPHRALGQLAPAQAPTRPPQINLAEHRIRRKQVLGRLTSEHHLVA